MYKLLDGKQLSEHIQHEIAIEVKQMIQENRQPPHLAAVLVGENGASITYVNAKVKACEKAGFCSSLFKLPAEISQVGLLSQINQLNNNPDIDGFIVQLPLPAHINESDVVQSVKPEKDVDGFHPANIGRMMLNLPAFLPATPYGILQLLERYEVQTEGKHCAVIGRSNIVGMPMSVLMARKAYPGNCTVTLAHSKTKNLKEVCRNADIIIAALGKPGFLTGDMVKGGVVVVDVGITRVKDETKQSGYKLIGDVNFAEVAPKCSWITPVPGGVGPMTITALMMNTLKAARKR